MRDKRELRDQADDHLEELRRQQRYLIIVGALIVIGALAEDIGTGGAGLLDDPATIGAGATMIWQGFSRVPLPAY